MWVKPSRLGAKVNDQIMALIREDVFFKKCVLEWVFDTAVKTPVGPHHLTFQCRDLSLSSNSDSDSCSTHPAKQQVIVEILGCLPLI